MKQIHKEFITQEKKEQMLKHHIRINKISILFLFFILFSCDLIENECPKKLANNILNSKYSSIDSVFEANRPITNFYTDSVIKNQPSVYFKNCKEYFNKEYFLTTIGSSSLQTSDYIFSYKCKTEEKVVEFKFLKKNSIWSLREINVLEFK